MSTRRDELTRQAARLFAEKGYHGTSIGDLAEAMGVQKGSRLRAHRVEADLLYETLRDGADAFHAALDADPGGAAGRREAPPRAARAPRVVAEQLDVATVWTPRVALPRGRAARRVRRRAPALRERIRGLFREGVELGSCAPTSTPRPRCSSCRPRTGPTRGSAGPGTDELADRFFALLVDGMRGYSTPPSLSPAARSRPGEGRAAAVHPASRDEDDGVRDARRSSSSAAARWAPRSPGTCASSGSPTSCCSSATRSHRLDVEGRRRHPRAVRGRAERAHRAALARRVRARWRASTSPARLPLPARRRGRRRRFQAALALQHSLGVPSRELSVAEALGIVPQLDPDGLLAATFCDLDGHATPEAVVQWYARGPTSGRGARRPGSASRAAGSGVETERGRIATGPSSVRGGVVVGGRRDGGLEIPVRGEPRWMFFTPEDGGLPSGCR